MDLWDIADEYKEAPPFNTNPKVLKEYPKCVKKAMSIIVFKLANTQFMQIRSSKHPTYT